MVVTACQRPSVPALSLQPKIPAEPGWVIDSTGLNTGQHDGLTCVLYGRVFEHDETPPTACIIAPRGLGRACSRCAQPVDNFMTLAARPLIAAKSADVPWA
jgi:hypothetical protein